MLDQNWELVADVNANGELRVRKYVSRQSQLRVVIADVDGPLVNGYFCVATEAHDDDGLPHTLEHLIFLGSDDYPYKGVLDLIANRCLSSGTNAWTDTDHTCYTMTTVGHEGFLNMLPVYVDHILFPTLTKSGYVTEVHHVTGEGEDAGVVYCEMQGRESSGESRAHLELMRSLFPGKCGYKSETGGILKNLRESTSHEKVVKYHQDYYRAENLCLIITGKIDPGKVFKALDSAEKKSVAKAATMPHFHRPWQSAVPPLVHEVDREVHYPCDDEKNGLVYVAWRGPSGIKDFEKFFATFAIMEYLTESAVSPLKAAFVESADPLASSVGYSIMEQSECAVVLMFKNVPNDKIEKVKPLLHKSINLLLTEGPHHFDMARTKVVLNRRISELKAMAENDPHGTVAQMVIGDMLYGQEKSDLDARLNPQRFFEDLLQKRATFWLDMLKEILKKQMVIIRGKPSKQLQKEIATVEANRIQMQRKTLGDDGLKAKADKLQKAVAKNEVSAPAQIFAKFSVPSISSVKFHSIETWNSSSGKMLHNMNLKELNATAIFSHIKSNFVYLFAIMDTHNVPKGLRPYLPLLSEIILESPMDDSSNSRLPYEEVVKRLDADVVIRQVSIGFSGRRFNCGPFSQYLLLFLQVEKEKYSLGVEWLSNLLHKTVLDLERIKVIATKIQNGIAEMKRDGRVVVKSALKMMSYSVDSNQHWNVILRQQKFLQEILQKLTSHEFDKSANKVIQDLNDLRTHLLQNICLFVAANFNKLEAPLKPWKKSHFQKETKPPPINLFLSDSVNVITGNNHIIIGLGSCESSFLLRTCKGIADFQDTDLAPLMLFFQYLTQLEGPMWRKIRGSGLAYGYSLTTNVDQGLLYFGLTKSTNPIKAYKVAKKLVSSSLKPNYDWNELEFESAKSSLIFEQLENYQSISGVVGEAVLTTLKNIDSSYLPKLLEQILHAKIEDLKRVGEKYVKDVFDSKASRTVLVCHPSKVEKHQNEFAKVDIALELLKEDQEVKSG